MVISVFIIKSLMPIQVLPVHEALSLTRCSSPLSLSCITDNDKTGLTTDHWIQIPACIFRRNHESSQFSILNLTAISILFKYLFSTFPNFDLLKLSALLLDKLSVTGVPFSNSSIYSIKLSYLKVQFHVLQVE